METFWFMAVAFMITMYVLLDGFDLGAGAIHPFVARSDDERRMVLRAIGPVWDGNEVWIIAAGGTLFFTFPQLYASSFSGFYLPLIMVLWLLMKGGSPLSCAAAYGTRSGARSGTRLSSSEARCSRSSSARLWATSYAACP